jgi:serine/threonine-protein kinase HipA
LRCLSCGKEISDIQTSADNLNGWHVRCIKAFFGTRTLPVLDISDHHLTELASAAVNRGLTVPGVQKKLSLNLINEPEARLTIVDYPTGFILKPPTEEYDSLPEFEDLAMRLADLVGIQTVPHALIRLNNQYAYITRRIDRDVQKGAVRLYAMEDFCQLSNRLTQDKYRGSYENCGRIIRKYSTRPGLDMSELFLRVAFSFIIGNSDMHLKNFSLRESSPGSREFTLSGAYDLLPVNVILPEDKDQLALTMNGKKRNIRRNDFLIFAQNCGIGEKPANAMLNKLHSMRDELLHECAQSFLSDQLKSQMEVLITQRADIIAVNQ